MGTETEGQYHQHTRVWGLWCQATWGHLDHVTASDVTCNTVATLSHFFFSAACVSTSEAELQPRCMKDVMAFAHQKLEVDPYGTLRSLVRSMHRTQVHLFSPDSGQFPTESRAQRQSIWGQGAA